MSSTDLKEILRRIEFLEIRDKTNGAQIVDLEKENKLLKEQVKELQNFKTATGKREATKQACVFSARITITNEDLSVETPPFKPINKCIKVYHASPAFDATTCRFTAPVDGHYNMDMGVRQNEKLGCLEVMLMIGANGEFNHAYIGKTTGAWQVCHKTMVVSLKQGDTVHGVVRRVNGSKSTGIFWCAFHGYLIAATSDHVSFHSPVVCPAPPPSVQNSQSVKTTPVTQQEKQ